MDETPFSETFGAHLRQFFRELFGSRLTAHLEEELLRLRNDHNQALHDRDVQIAALREEKAQLNSKIIIYENTVMAHSSKMGAEVVAYSKPEKPKPNFSFVDMPETKSRWQAVQDAHNEQMAKEIAEDNAKAATAAQKE